MNCCAVPKEPGRDYDCEVLPPGWYNGVDEQVPIRRKNGSVQERPRWVIVSISLFHSYLQEPMEIIASKCKLLFFGGLSLYFIGYTVWHLIRLPVATLFNCSLQVFAEQIWTIARIPFYFIALESAALYGASKPLDGRAWFADLEKQLHGGKDFRKDVCRGKDPHFLWNCWEGLTSKDPSSTFFVGFCFQPLDSGRDIKLEDGQTIQIPRGA